MTTSTLPDAFCAACPSRALLARLGEKWSALALSALAQGPARFGALRRRLEGVSQKMLTQSLRALERDGLIEREVLDRRPLAVEYRLTDLGTELVPLVDALKRWSEATLVQVTEANERFEAAERDRGIGR